MLTTDDPLVWATRTGPGPGVIATSVLAEPDAPDAIWAPASRPTPWSLRLHLEEKVDGACPSRSASSSVCRAGTRWPTRSRRQRRSSFGVSMATVAAGTGHGAAAFALADGADRADRRRADRQRRLQRQPRVDAGRPGHRRRRAAGSAGGQGMGGAGGHARARYRARRGTPVAGWYAAERGICPDRGAGGSSPTRWCRGAESVRRVFERRWRPTAMMPYGGAERPGGR